MGILYRFNGNSCVHNLQIGTLSLLRDALTLWPNAQVDAKSAERGLHHTLDSLHLNGAGADLFDRELAAAIRLPSSIGDQVPS